ncbi:MAG TPA: hypothetical protein VFP58_11440 [Candidatus Eisenbacteria bacterium]|nr:hypothetical protein [Candidatus Eisenbacteria bacterium]
MIRALPAALGRHARLLLVLLVLGVTAFQVARVLRTELEITGGGISLPLDDSFIYLQYSRAIADGHPFVYTPGNEPTTGATSLGWPLLLLPPHLLRLGPELCVAWALALGIVGFLASALLMARLGARLGGLVGGALALLLFLVSPHLLWGYLSGMEIPLYGTVLLASVSVYLDERLTARFRRLPWWLLALALSRPEGAILCFVFGLLMSWDAWRAGRERQDGETGSATPSPNSRTGAAARLLLPFVAGALPFLVNLAVSGTIESTSSQAKSIFSEPYRETRTEYVTNAPTIWRDIATCYLTQFLLDDRTGPLPRMILPSAAGIALYVLFAFVPRRRPWPGGTGLILLVLAGIVVNSIPVFWQVHMFRYQQGLLPLVLLVYAAGWGRLAWFARGRVPGPVAVGAAALALAAPLAAWLPLLVRANGEIIRFYGHNCENILHQQVATGRWIDANLPKDAIVGLNDAGAIAYYGRRSTVDLVGLTTAGFAPVYRSGLGCLFEHLRRLPEKRLPTYFAIYPEWFPYWTESGILGPESYRATLAFNTIAGGVTKVVYPASWIDVRPTDRPVRTDAPELRAKRVVDELDHAWLEGERRHAWSAEPEAKDVLRRYAYADVRTRPVTDAGRILRGDERFEASVTPGRDLVLVMRTDAWYPSRLRVEVDGKPAGTWSIARSESVWIEPRIAIPGGLLTRERPEFRIRREREGEAFGRVGVGRDYTPFHYWLYQ